jgi:hypothetical protein
MRMRKRAPPHERGTGQRSSCPTSSGTGRARRWVLSALGMGTMYFTETDGSRERKHEVMNSRVTLQKILRHALPLLILFAILLTSARVSRAQAPSGAVGQDNPPGEKARGNPSETQIHNDKNEAKQEVSMQDTGTTFKLRVNLVQVRARIFRYTTRESCRQSQRSRWKRRSRARN